MAFPPGPWAPMIVQTASFLRRPLRFVDRCQRRYGDVFSVRLGFTGPKRGVVVGNSELIRDVFMADSEQLSGAEGNAPLRPVMGDHSVGMLDGVPHARRRRLLTPPFHGERMRAYADTMREATLRHARDWPREPFSLLPRLLDLTLEIILRTVFGTDDADLEEVRLQLRRFLDVVANPLVLMVPALQRDLPLLPWRRFLQERAATDKLLYRRIAQARASKTPQDDILGMLVQAVDDTGASMSDVELRDELVALLMAGHETTATSLAWIFERILSHREVFDDLVQELDTVVGDGPIEGAHVPKLELLEATIREAMRMRPAAPGAFRKSTMPWKIGGFDIPAGTVIMASSQLANRQADVYPDPGRFDPKRFVGKKPDAYAWIPFGGGSRRCIGMAYALYEMKVICATLLRAVRMELVDAKPVDITCRAVFLSPVGGLRVRAQSLPESRSKPTPPERPACRPRAVPQATPVPPMMVQ